MCISMPKPKKPDLLPGAPPPPEKAPVAPEVPASDKNKGNVKKKGRTSLRIDLNPAASSGLRI